jgi:membrane associated rhomboid family serine protease
MKYRYQTFGVVERLIVILVACFVLPFILRAVLYLFTVPFDQFFTWFELSASFEDTFYRPWTILTYAFFHGDFGHIFWNLILLYFSGRMMVNLFKPQLFINTFFLGVLVGGATFVLSYNFFPAFEGQSARLIGSSAGVMAVLIFMCTYMPFKNVRIFVFNIKLIYIGLFFISVDLIQIPVNNSGGHLAHLGGALIGFLYQRNIVRGNDFGQWISNLWKTVLSLISFNKTRIRKVYNSPSPKPNQKSVNQEKIDQILDKISQSGYASLTKEEKELLFRAGKS